LERRDEMTFERMLYGWLVLYFMFFLMELVMTGTSFSGSNIGDLSGALQPSIMRNPFEGTGVNPLQWMGATLNYLKSWGAVLLLQSNPVFAGDYGQIFRWALLLGPMVVGLSMVMRAVGR